MTADYSRLQDTEKFWARLCFDGKFKPQGRYRVYRELVTDRMVDTVKNISPVARSLLSDREWRTLLWDFLKKSPPRSEILRELAWEFSQHLKGRRHPLWVKYPYLGELLEYEYLEIRMRFAPEDERTTPAGKLRLNPAHVLARYQWPVHFIGEDFRDAKRMPKGEYHLLLWREPESLEVRFMEVNPLLASILGILASAPKAPEALLKAAARKHRLPPSREYMEEGRALLQDLKRKSLLV